MTFHLWSPQTQAAAWKTQAAARRLSYFWAGECRHPLGAYFKAIATAQFPFNPILLEWRIVAWQKEFVGLTNRIFFAWAVLSRNRSLHAKQHPVSIDNKRIYAFFCVAGRSPRKWIFSYAKKKPNAGTTINYLQVFCPQIQPQILRIFLRFR